MRTDDVRLSGRFRFSCAKKNEPVLCSMQHRLVFCMDRNKSSYEKCRKQETLDVAAHGDKEQFEGRVIWEGDVERFEFAA